MRKMNWFARFTALILLMLFACEGSGTARGVSSNCNSNNTGGSCQIKIDSLQGTYFTGIKNDSLRLGPTQVQVNLSASVGQGSVRIYIRDGKDQETSTLVKAGQTAQLSGPAGLSPARPRSFNVYLAVQGDTTNSAATDVQIKVDYQVVE